MLPESLYQGERHRLATVSADLPGHWNMSPRLLPASWQGAMCSSLAHTSISTKHTCRHRPYTPMSGAVTGKRQGEGRKTRPQQKGEETFLLLDLEGIVLLHLLPAAEIYIPN